jgi:Zn ribbon nucleic-acid-binding protein
MHPSAAGITFTMTHTRVDQVVHVGTGVPACPSCREPDSIEPLERQDAVWHVRCLSCGFGFTFTQRLWPSADERRRLADRRQTARSGRRATDLPRAVSCDRCASLDVHGWLRTGDTLWARCATCGRVQRVES